MYTGYQIKGWRQYEQLNDLLLTLAQNLTHSLKYSGVSILGYGPFEDLQD